MCRPSLRRWSTLKNAIVRWLLPIGCCRPPIAIALAAQRFRADKAAENFDTVVDEEGVVAFGRAVVWRIGQVGARRYRGYNLSLAVRVIF